MQTRQARPAAIGPKTSVQTRAARGALQPAPLMQALVERGVADGQSLLQLQRTIGNSAVGELLGVQPKPAEGPASPAQGRGKPSSSRVKNTSATSVGPVQRKFGFEIELPMLLTQRADKQVKSLADGSNINMPAVPRDPSLGGAETNLVDLADAYINVDHSRTLNKLYEADLAKYAVDQGLDANETASLKAESGQLMPSGGGTSIVEVVTNPWDENALDRPQALAKVRSVIRDVTTIYDHIAGDTAATAGGYRFGSSAPNSSVFQPRLGYFHATYGIKLAQVPKLFEKTTKQKKALKKYAKTNQPEKEHAKNVELTSQSVSAAQSAMKEIKRLWPRIVVARKILPDKTKIAMSSAAEKDFLGLLTLLANYFLLMNAHVGGDDLGKKLVGMHYYKSDLYDVATQLPAEVIDPLQDADRTLVDGVIDALCNAVGIDKSEKLGGALGGKTVMGYCYQIFRGHFGVIKEAGADKLDASGQTFMDPVLAHSINPWSSKLGPEQLGPAGNKGLGVVLENRHLEYLDPEYGNLVDTQQETMRDEAVQYGPPKAGLDARTADDKAMYDSISAREEGPARRPIAEWETMMMNIYDMVKGLNRRE